MSNESLNLKKIRYNCRRGMCELEDILYPFFDNHFQQLTEPEKQDYIMLLRAEDTDLWDWLITKQSESPDALREIIKKIHAAT